MTFRYERGELYADQVDVARLAAEVGTPCYVYSRDRILENWSQLRDTFPQAEIHYSLKANANLALVRLLVQTGAGLDAVARAGRFCRSRQDASGA